MLTAWWQHLTLLNAMRLTSEQDIFVPDNIILSDYTVRENWKVMIALTLNDTKKVQSLVEALDGDAYHVYINVIREENSLEQNYKRLKPSQVKHDPFSCRNNNDQVQQLYFEWLLWKELYHYTTISNHYQHHNCYRICKYRNHQITHRSSIHQAAT